MRKNFELPVEDEIKGEAYEVDVTKLTSMVKAGLTGHLWRQKGAFLICKGCEIEHGIYIGVEYHLVRCDENGMPVLKKVETRG